jgi:hypothetical protein
MWHGITPAFKSGYQDFEMAALAMTKEFVFSR